MSTETITQVGNGVPRERIIGVAGGDIPRSLAEIDAAGAFAAEFLPQWSSSTPEAADNPPIYTRFDAGRPIESVTAEEYRRIAKVGTRDYWRLDDQSRRVFQALAQGEVPPAYQLRVAGMNGDELAMLRQEARDRLVLSSVIDQAHTQEVRDLWAGRRALRVPLHQVVLPPAPEPEWLRPPAAPQPLRPESTQPEGRGGRHRRQGFIGRALGRLTKKLLSVTL